jgi:hypothetical protein
MKRSAWLLPTIVLGTLAVAEPALANGRYPLSNQLVVSPKDATHIAVRATFGLVLSADSGKSWTWVCEAAAQFVNGEDPPLELTADSSLIISSSAVFTTSHDFGCNWDQPEQAAQIVDADVDRSAPNRVVTATQLFENAKYNLALRESLDNGKTWNALGVETEGYVLTDAIAPSQPTRIYVSTTSLTTGTPSVVRTDDNGATWHPYVLPLMNAPVPYIAAVDPKNADRVYVRAPTSDNTGDVLLVSENAGKDWKQILKMKGTLAGFALSPDGSQLMVGGPADPVQLASTTDYQFSDVNALNVTCLTWADAGIFACADQATAKFSVGLSKDQGKTFEPAFEPPKLTLQVCAAGTPVADSCPNGWHGLAPIIGADPATPGYSENGGGMSTTAGTGPTSGGGGAANEAGTTTSGGSAAGAVSSAGKGGISASGGGGNPGGAPGTATANTSSGCAVTSPARGTALSILLSLTGVLALARRRRRT